MRVEKAPAGRRASRSDADYNLAKKQKQERIDAILDKISAHGLESLTEQERRTLERASQRMSGGAAPRGQATDRRVGAGLPRRALSLWWRLARGPRLLGPRVAGLP